MRYYRNDRCLGCRKTTRLYDGMDYCEDCAPSTCPEHTKTVRRPIIQGLRAPVECRECGAPLPPPNRTIKTPGCLWLIALPVLWLLTSCANPLVKEAAQQVRDDMQDAHIQHLEDRLETIRSMLVEFAEEQHGVNQRVLKITKDAAKLLRQWEDIKAGRVK